MYEGSVLLWCKERRCRAGRGVICDEWYPFLPKGLKKGDKDIYDEQLAIDQGEGGVWIVRHYRTNCKRRLV